MIPTRTMISFRSACLFALLGVTMVAQLISGSESSCATCSKNDMPKSFSVQNSLPEGNSHFRMECICASQRTTGLDLPPVEIKECSTVVTPTEFCGPTPKLPESELEAYRSRVVLCQFHWISPTSKNFRRSGGILWNRYGPQKRYYKVDADGAYFSKREDCKWIRYDEWSLSNAVSEEAELTGAEDGFETFGNDNYRRKSSVS